MSFAAYAVAIKLNLVDGLSPAMMAASRHIKDTHGHVTDLEKRLDSIQKMFKAGAVMTGAGVGLAFAMKAATGEAVRFEQQLNKIKALNLGPTVTGQLTALADKMSNSTKGTSQTEALRLVTETQAITGNAAHTMELAPYLAKMRFGMETFMSGGGHGEGHGASSEKQFADIIKVMEMRGLMRNFTEDNLHRMGDLFVRNYVASGGMVKPSDFLAMMKTGGVAAKSISPEFMFAMSHIQQEMGGSRSGTALMSTYQNLVAGRMPQQIAETLNKLGLLDKSAIHYGKTGHITKVDPGGLKHSDLLISRPDLYLRQEILPALKKAGVDITNQQAVLMKLNSMAGQRTASNFLAQMFLEGGQISNYMDQAMRAKGVDGLYGIAENSTIGKQIDLQAKLLNLEKTMGDSILPLQIKAYETLIPMVQKFNTWLENSPGKLEVVVYGLAALSASLMISGPLLMVASGFKAVGLAIDVLAGAGGIPKLLSALGAGGGGGLLAMAGKATAVGAAGYAGWEIGSWLNDSVINPSVKNYTDGKYGSIGEALADKWTDDHGNFSVSRAVGGVKDADRKPVQTVQSGRGNGEKQGDVYLDGKKVGAVMAPHLAAPMGVGMTGLGFDNVLSLPQPGVR